MQNIKEVFSSFSVNDLDAAKQFYGDTLGLNVEDGKMGLVLKMVGGGTIFIYPKANHEPASFTVLNIEVENIDSAVDELIHKGVTLERYEGMEHDAKGIVRSTAAHEGPDIGWFKDPAGNVVSVLQR